MNLCNQLHENKYKCLVYLFKDFIMHYVGLYEQIQKDSVSSFNALEDVIKYVLTERGIKNSDSNRRNYRNIIKRCVFLYKKYGKKLEIVYFSLSNMSRIYKTNWKKWLEYLNEVIISMPKNDHDDQDTINFEQNKEMLLKMYHEIDFTKLEKGQNFSFINKNGNTNDKRFNGLCCRCKRDNAERHNDNMCKNCKKADKIGAFPTLMDTSDEEDHSLDYGYGCIKCENYVPELNKKTKLMV